MSVWKRIAFVCLAWLALGMSSIDATAAPQPKGSRTTSITVTSATPSSAYAGTVSLDVVVGGNGFDSTAQVQYVPHDGSDAGGITVKKVTYRKTTELLTSIDIAAGAKLTDFDVVVTLSDGRKGKGTTLFKVQAAPTYPAGRFWFAFTSNGGDNATTSRLYMFGGSTMTPTGSLDFNELWAYVNAGSNGSWTFVPTGTPTPSPRHGMGWSCGGGNCVTSNGVYGGLLKETWKFSESTRTWSQVNCNRLLCPSARIYPTMAYNPVNDTHVLFGGMYDSSTVFGDTYTFSPSKGTWVSHGTSSVVSGRRSAAAIFVPAISRIVMFGGQQRSGSYFVVLNGMYSWDGSVWSSVQQGVDATLSAVPGLHSHSMAWDAVGNRLIVTGGYVDTSDTPNNATFYVSFANVGGVWKATWTLAAGVGCQSVAGSSDATVHHGAMMAFDIPARMQVFFGGVDNGVNGAFAWDNTVECQ